MQKVLVIVGPTAVGKTSFGIACAKQFDGEIISGDSIQVYKGLDIGSAKVKKEEMDGIVHHLIDIKDPKENYSVKEFQTLARKTIDEIAGRGKLPIIVGGTGLYIKACLYDYQFVEEEEEDNPFEELSNQEIYEILEKEDPACLLKIHVNNRKRLVRALNILRKHGKMSEMVDAQKHEMLYDAKMIGLTLDRDVLYKKVEERIDMMMEEGLLEEIDRLLKSGVTFKDQSMQGIGYKEFEGYIQKEKTLEEVLQEIKRNTRHFVKRQYTWFKHQTPITWFDVEEKEEALKEIEQWMHS